MATIFNATEYLALYPELAQFGLNADNVYEAHYVPYGAAELRAPNNELAGKIYPASVLAYANGNPELAEAFGVTVPATELTATQQADLVLHYVNYGNAEDRANKLVDAPVEEQEVPVTDLVEAIVALQNATAEYEDTLSAAAEKLGTDDIDQALTDADSALVALKYADNSGAILPNFDSTDSLAVKEAMLVATEAKLNSSVELAKLGLTPAQQSAVIRFEQAKVDMETATEAMYSANVAAGVPMAVYNTTAGAAAASIGAVQSIGTAKLVSISIATTTPTLLVVQKGKVVQVDGATTKAVDAAITEVAGYSALAAALIQMDKAAKGVDSAYAKLETTAETLAGFNAGTLDVSAVKTDDIKAVVGADGLEDELSAIDALALTGGIKAEAEALSNAQADLSAFEKLAESYRDALVENAKVTTAAEAQAEALEYLEDEFDVDVQVISVEDTILNATRADDLFVYAAGKETFQGEIFGFNQVGEDSIFFGSEFTWTVLAADADIEKAGNGDRDVLEILALQDGSDLVLYVETDAAGGTVLGEANINTITLAGVNIDDVDFSAGFLTGVVA